MALRGQEIDGRLVFTDTRPTKYRAVKTTMGGTNYASRKEAEYCEGLKHLQRAGEIRKLRLQVPFDLVVNGQKICTYIADATYIDNQTGEHITLDIKGFRTKEYRLKKKLMKAVFAIEIKEV